MHCAGPTGRSNDVNGKIPAPKGLGFSARMVSVTATISEHLLCALPVSPLLISTAAYGDRLYCHISREGEIRLKEDEASEHAIRRAQPNSPSSNPRSILLGWVYQLRHQRPPWTTQTMSCTPGLNQSSGSISLPIHHLANSAGIVMTSCHCLCCASA